MAKIRSSKLGVVAHICIPALGRAREEEDREKQEEKKKNASTFLEKLKHSHIASGNVK
jgi:hypothetical protein